MLPIASWPVAEKAAMAGAYLAVLAVPFQQLASHGFWSVSVGERGEMKGKRRERMEAAKCIRDCFIPNPTGTMGTAHADLDWECLGELLPFASLWFCKF